jgi:hypothetical protein
LRRIGSAEGLAEYASLFRPTHYALTTGLWRNGICAVIQALSQTSSNEPSGRSILRTMTKLLEKALEAVRQLPPDSQDAIARAMLTLAGDEGELEEIDPAHLPDVLESLAQTKRREFATDAEVEAAFRRFD